MTAATATAPGNLRCWLRRRRRWQEFQEARREGFARAWRRRRVQGMILGTPPLRTAPPGSGAVEVRVLTWRRDWINMIWALKSFYHFAQVDSPLWIHDGGLAPGQAEALGRHFPGARFVGAAEADGRVARQLARRGLPRCRAYRERNVSTRKLFDFFLMSESDHVVSIDSDIVFFRRPDLLLVPPGASVAVNRYNEDCGDWYSMAPDELEASFGLRPPPRINSGLALVRRESIDFGAIEGWLEHPSLYGDAWVTEQTLHALCSARHGVELLPPSYRVGTEPGLDESTVCKHYPGYFRPLLYEEGMARLVESGFLGALRGEAEA